MGNHPFVFNDAFFRGNEDAQAFLSLYPCFSWIAGDEQKKGVKAKGVIAFGKNERKQRITDGSFAEGDPLLSPKAITPYPLHLRCIGVKGYFDAYPVPLRLWRRTFGAQG